MSDRSGESKGLQVSLRTYLIVILVLGLTLGLLGRLFRVQPEVFIGVVGLISTVVPFLLAIATILRLGNRQLCVARWRWRSSSTPKTSQRLSVQRNLYTIVVTPSSSFWNKKPSTIVL